MAELLLSLLLQLLVATGISTDKKDVNATSASSATSVQTTSTSQSNEGGDNNTDLGYGGSGTWETRD
ncbi:hypothetical protein [Rufibacter immobilis]|uniref:hypothetical protein n=1 Tax=Rufibacter immobilis TaxID=1348778 RepID=UPI0011CDE71D|nr:hypothetical protein [Rufibacter immobilis]